MATNLSYMLCGELSGNTGRFSIAVRHCWLPGNPNVRPSPRPVAGASAVCGLPPAAENRPSTGVRPGANTAAVDNSLPLPLLSNQPATATPLAWLVRYPECRPNALLKTSRNACGVSRDGPIQLIAVSNAAASAARKAPTAAAPRSRSRRPSVRPSSSSLRLFTTIVEHRFDRGAPVWREKTAKLPARIAGVTP